MKRILLSLTLIVAATSAVFGGTTAFFSDTETSTANVFTAGDIDLKIDNESYYNGVINQGTSWSVRDLTIERFFDFADLKPSDYGEDTISIHVDTNDAYLCADFTLTSNDDNLPTEPEALDDATTGVGQGELAQLVNFIWWADDGDNVLESDESVITGPTVVGQLPVGQKYSLTLADSIKNIWNPQATPGPVEGDQTYYIGKAWCFGAMTVAPLVQDGGDQGRSPALDNNADGKAGTPADGGFSCSGALLGNESQTDSLTADVAFRAVQARHNSGFRCSVPPQELTTLTLVKQVFNSGPFDASPTEWTLSASGSTPLSGVSGVSGIVAPGLYDLSEIGPNDFSASNWLCVGGVQIDGDTISIAQGDSVTCTVTNYIACEQPVQAYANKVVAFNQGVKKNGQSVDANRSDPTKALGAPQSGGTPFDNPAPLGEFFSLGFDERTDDTPNEGGWIVVEFPNYIIDGPGNDLKTFEITGGTAYPIERVKIEVSQNGTQWFPVSASVDRDAEADLANSGLTWANYVRLTDVSNRAEFEDGADGYDLDAFRALNCAVKPVVGAASAG